MSNHTPGPLGDAIVSDDPEEVGRQYLERIHALEMFPGEGKNHD